MTTRQQYQLGLAATCMCVLLLATPPALAYLDPSLGSYALQILIASFVATAFVMKTLLRRIADFLTRRKGSAAKEEPADD